jgi:predicted O-methyltransferase YrrM
VSKQWKEILWHSVTDLDTKLIAIESDETRSKVINDLFSRLNFRNILKLVLGKKAFTKVTNSDPTKFQILKTISSAAI